MPECGEHPSITPETRVGDLLARRPELEQTLLSLSPAYQALKNPVLRRTVARVATLRQVARVGGLPVAKLVSVLREAAGEKDAVVADAAETPGAPAGSRPERVVGSYDARADIEAGNHPMPRVMKELQKLAPGESFELVTGFVPAPLMDLAREKGFRSASAQDSDGLVRTWFTRPGPR